jgi:hypothetical protein
MRPAIRRLTAEQFLSLLASVRPSLTRRITSVHLHHTWRPTRAQFRGLATIEGMRNYHIGLKWDDIAQHLTIDPMGTAWTGRNWNLPPASQSGKNGKPDAGPFMIEIVGDFDEGRDVLDGEQRASVHTIVAGILEEYGLDATKHVHFHRDLGSPKTCPGSGVDKKRLISEIGKAAAVLRSIAATPRGRGTAARRGKRTPAEAPARPLLLPVEFLASRDVADRTDGPSAGYETWAVSEDGVSARSLAIETTVRTRDAIDVPTLIARASDEWRDLRPYVVNLSEGKLSRGGAFEMDDQSIADIIDSIRTYAGATPTPRLMLHAHGGLVSERSALEYTRSAWKWWRDHGVYPIYFVWETSAFEVIRNRLGLGRGIGDWWDRRFERFARPLGRPLWDDMKDYALKASAADAGGGEAGGARTFATALRALVASPPAGKAIALHAVGHSAGAIFHSHFVPMLIGQGMTVENLSLLAPAVRIDLFKQMVVPRLTDRSIKRLEMYTMDEEAEKGDDLVKALGIPIYGKSLLYLISNAFEPEEEEAGILGLDERFRDDAEITGLFAPGGRHRLEFSHAKGKPHNPATHARMHGCFDNDNATLRSLLKTITGMETTVGFPVGDGKCDKASSRALERGADGWLSVPTTPAVAAPVLRAAAKQGTRRALCVGIDSYATSPLAGCVSDARAWVRALSELGFDVKTVLDREATRQRILDALSQLIGSARPGDTLVFQYAGHGSQAEDLNGDESDRFDESLVPIDYTTGALLIDDDLADVYRRLPQGVGLTLFMDCCHSGTNSRFAPLDRSRARADERRRFLDLTPELEEAHRRFRARAGSPPPAGHEESLPGIIHFAACLDSQYAYESGGHGHFTQVATSLLASAVESRQTNEAFAREVENKVVALGRPQTPRLMPLPAGSSGRPVLAATRRGADTGDTSVPPPLVSTPVATDDRAMAEWWLEFFENGAAQLRRRLGR